MKKRLLMALMAICMVASLAGCGDNGTSKKEVDIEENSIESGESETSTKESNVGQETEKTEQSDEKQEGIGTLQLMMSIQI